MDKIRELSIKSKDPIGQGAYHTVYPNAKDPETVIKTKTPKEIDYEGQKYTAIPNMDKRDIELMKNNPDLFAKVLKYNDRWAIIEKLDNKSIQSNLDNLANNMIKMFVNTPSMAKEMGFQDVFTLESQDLDPSAYLNFYRRDKVFLKHLYKFVTDKKFYIKLLTLIKEAYKRVGNIKHVIDIKYDNIGFDKEGNIKIFDI